MKSLKILISLIVFALFLSAGVVNSVSADEKEGKALVESKKCGSCHKMQGPPDKTIADVLKRKAPDLFYAWSKFKTEWLEKFLQKPTIIRPAGTVYLNNIKMGDKKDEIGDVKPCASNVSAKEAHEVTEYLMTLKEPTMKTGVIVDESFSKAKAKFGQKE